ncbi:MAG TPA: VOC family protein [Terracidiphilus sp.]|jgi:catechol 2,3-dioxygenase-like lactoylglutathione lyase family enzyme
MAESGGLHPYDIIAFVNIREPEQAEAFYRDVLGLRLVSKELPFALVFNAHGTMLRLAINPGATPIGGTVLGWRVPDMEAAVRDLGARGVQFERWEGMPQDELGIWSSPGGARVAWFKDPDGNVLSLSEHPG